MRQFAGWSAGSNLHLKYLHYFGNESSESLLEAYGIIPLAEEITLVPYAFANIDEINYFIKQAQAETIDSLFLKHKSIWKKIVVADNEVINLLAIDSLYSRY